MKPLRVALLLVIAVAIAADVKEIVQPKDVAAQLASKGPKPVIFQTGPNFLYRGKAEVAKLPKDWEIVLYCGCCPWDKCPNINPAIAMLKEMGYTKVKAMMVPDTFKKDWTDQGYPVEQSLQ